MNVECHSALHGHMDCYTEVLRETCNTSAADEIENMLQTVVYNAKLSLVRISCPVGKSYNIGHHCKFPHSYTCKYYFTTFVTAIS